MSKLVQPPNKIAFQGGPYHHQIKVIEGLPYELEIRRKDFEPFPVTGREIIRITKGRYRRLGLSYWYEWLGWL